MAGIGKPAQLVKNIVEKGEYTLYVFKRAKIVAAKRFNLNSAAQSNLIFVQEQDDAYVAKNITAEDIQTSTVPIIGCSTIVGTKNLCTIFLVEEQLQGICQNLLNSYKKDSILVIWIIPCM